MASSDSCERGKINKTLRMCEQRLAAVERGPTCKCTDGQEIGFGRRCLCAASAASPVPSKRTLCVAVLARSVLRAQTNSLSCLPLSAPRPSALLSACQQAASPSSKGRESASFRTMGKRRRLGDDGTEEGKRRRKMDVVGLHPSLFALLLHIMSSSILVI